MWCRRGRGLKAHGQSGCWIESRASLPMVFSHDLPNSGGYYSRTVRSGGDSLSRTVFLPRILLCALYMANTLCAIFFWVLAHRADEGEAFDIK